MMFLYPRGWKFEVKSRKPKWHMGLEVHQDGVKRVTKCNDFG